NNNKQLAVAQNMYSTDNKDYLPYPNWGNDFGPGWLYNPVSAAPPNLWAKPWTNNVIEAYKTGVYYQYMPNPKAFICPVDNNSKYFRARANKMSSYIMNGAVCGYGATGKNSCKVTAVWSPMCYIQWEPDETNPNPYPSGPPIGDFAFNDASSFPDRGEGVGKLHVSGAIVLALAGHVQPITFRQFQFEQTRAGKGFLWWNPGSNDGR
ncbi:MAG TPA: type II secretion system protein, partial [Clostridia bacterium]|nr:type II secretion system protein [Clostridia bacterium]